jgi:hypothetical protein
VNTLEDRVRAAFRADAETVRPESLPGLPGRPGRPARRAAGRRGPRRGRILIPLAAAGTVAAIAAGLTLATPLFHRPGRPGQPSVIGPFLLPGPRSQLPTGPAPAPALAADASRGVPTSAPAPGVPRFYVTAYVAPSGGANYLVVRDTATGHVVAQVTPPANAFFAGLAATAGDRTFITTIDTGTGCTPVQLYQFRLNHRGVPGPLTPLNITLPGGIPQGQGDLAITPDGRTIAYDSGVCSSRATPPEVGAEVGVINLATRRARAWAVPFTLANADASQIMDVSLSADGGLLGYATFDGTSVLPTSAPTGPLAARSRLVSGTVIWAAVAGDGDALYGCAVSPYSSDEPIPNVGALTYSRISLTGGGHHVVASWPRVTGPQCYASLDPAGGDLLVQFPAVAHGVDDWSRPAVLDLHTGKLTLIAAPPFYGPFDIAW